MPVTRTLPFLILTAILFLASPASAKFFDANPPNGILDGVRLPPPVEQFIEESDGLICIKNPLGGCIIELYCVANDDSTGGPPVTLSNRGIGIMVGQPGGAFGPYVGFAILC
jgi:hypothetical protein